MNIAQSSHTRIVYARRPCITPSGSSHYEKPPAAAGLKAALPPKKSAARSRNCENPRNEPPRRRAAGYLVSAT
jgi:hypothetical protein